MSFMSKHKHRLALGAGCVVSCLGAGVAVANAYTTGPYLCDNYSSSQVCYGGDNYHTYNVVAAQTVGSSDSVCAKAVSEAGTVKTGSGCNNFTTQRTSNLASTTPISASYVYWAGNGGARRISGIAQTP